MIPLTFQKLERIEDVPTAEELAALAVQRDSLTLRLATRLPSHSVDGTDAPTLFLNALKEELIPLLPSSRAVRTYVSRQGI